MKILLVGAFGWGSTDCWKKLALERSGHRVVPWPYRERTVRECFAQGEPFDLVFVSKGVPLTEGDFTHLATLGTRRLLWWPDPFENWDDAHTAALRTGAWSLSATSEVVLRKILATQHDVTSPQASTCLPFRSARILEGCDCEGPKWYWKPERVERSLLHFGAMTPRREAVIERVRSAGIEVRVLEHPLYGAALQREVLRHAAVLGINSSPDLYSNRVQTVLAMGGVMLQEVAPDVGLDFGRSFDGLLWVDETLPDAARVILSDRFTRGDVSPTVFQKFRWERVMERAVAFACGGPA